MLIEDIAGPPEGFRKRVEYPLDALADDEFPKISEFPAEQIRRVLRTVGPERGQNRVEIRQIHFAVAVRVAL
jgi:hypothetical protein